MHLRVTNRSPDTVYVLIASASPAGAPILGRSQLAPGTTELTSLPGTFDQRGIPQPSGERPAGLARSFRLRVEAPGRELLAESEFTGSAFFLLTAGPEGNLQLLHGLLP